MPKLRNANVMSLGQFSGLYGEERTAECGLCKGPGCGQVAYPLHPEAAPEVVGFRKLVSLEEVNWVANEHSVHLCGC